MTQGRRLPATLFACLTAALAFAVQAHAASITFEEFGAGTAITTQYGPQGVVFSSNGGGPAHIWADAPEATSSPNILVGLDNYGDIFATFVNPQTGEPSPLAAPCVSFNVISVGHAVVHVRSRNSANLVLEDFELTHPGGPENGFGAVDSIVFSAGTIASFEVVFTVSNPNDGIGIDDLIVDGTGCATPARASSWGTIKVRYR